MHLNYTNPAFVLAAATQKPASMNNCTAKVVLRTYQRKRSNDRAFALQAFINGQKIVLGLGFGVDAKYYNEKNNTVKLPADQKELEANYNYLLRDAKTRALDIFSQANRTNIELTRELFEKVFRGEVYTNFIQYTYKALEVDRHSIGDRAYQHHVYVLKKMTAFKPNWQMSDVNHGTIKEFDAWIRKHHDFKQNYIAKIHSSIRKFVNTAINDNVAINNPYKTFKIQKVTTQPVFLTLEELKMLIDLYVNNDLPPTHFEVLAAYIFVATSGGFRISDWKRLTTENIVGNQIVFTPHKTKKFKSVSIRLEITNIGRQIIAGRTGLLFKVPSDQKVNEYLKEIAMLAGINKRVTSHTARHTFATQYLENGGKIERLQLILGHSKLTETMVYAHITDKTVSQSMQVMNVFELPP